jgi:predicted nucleic acid-binding protein
LETVVIDANVGVALVCPLPYSSGCRDLMEKWIRSGARIAVPFLWDYEIISALRKQWAQGQISRDAAVQALKLIDRLPIERIEPDMDLSLASMGWAERLGQLVAYDAQYLSLAERLNGQFFTSDRKLHFRCQEMEVGFIHLIV